MAHVLGWFAAVAAGLTGLGYLTRQVRRGARKVREMVDAVRAIRHLVERELDHNHGSSMKDDIHGMAVAIGLLQRARESDRRRLDRALRLAAKHHPEDAWLYFGPDERTPG